MALQPFSYQGKDTLQPGSRGESFKADLPGFRGNEERRNRSNMNLSTSEHDVPNIKWDLDRRLPVLFRHGYAVGYNQLVMPKGRIVAVDPYMNQLDFDTHKSLNVLTLANGGSIVKLKDGTKNWETVTGEYQEAPGNEKIYVSLKTVSTPPPVAPGGQKSEDIAVAAEPVYGVDALTGKVTVDSKVKDDYRPANRPVGMIQRNEYTRDDDAFNGMQPGAVLTDMMVELPLFAIKEKAEQNPWGSVYGNILPGDLLKSDENGRLVVSPLSRPEILAKLSAQQIEVERQQIVAQVYEVSRDLLPAGAAKYAQWALSDRMNFDQFNPFLWRGNGRRGEDINEKSPYSIGTGGAVSGTKNYAGEDPLTAGYGYDQTLTQNDLHMLASTARKSDLRLGLEYQTENGIPGLTDGYNAVSRKFGPETLGEIKKASSEGAYVDMFYKLSQVNAEKGSIEIAVTTKSINELKDSDFVKVAAAGQGIKPFIGSASAATEELRVKYMDELQGFIVLEVADKAAFHKESFTTPLNVYARYNKRGLAGVPTFMDWDGCMGSVSVLLQK